ncbi:hypothetical protein [Chroococcidiopsis sp. CCMEE 29]|uniref:hypothetical protein n=1 Tax=Chroococcidiopsis sp. CCMEE 29 TaxID=155894 RepID=UPI0020217D92|nr:hypothetical protein [Chroococcidiopsis sp. CCMEE 29]
MNLDNPRVQVYLTKLVSEDGTGSTIDSENSPIEERCGLEDIDTIMDGLLVLAPLDNVAEVLAQSGVRWEREMYSQNIRGSGLLVFQ